MNSKRLKPHYHPSLKFFEYYVDQINLTNLTRKISDKDINKMYQNNLDEVRVHPIEDSASLNYDK